MIVFTLENLSSGYSLNQVTYFRDNGYISQELFDKFYHLWRANPYLLGDHYPCFCEICQSKRNYQYSLFELE